MRMIRAVFGLALASIALLSGCGGAASDATSKELAALTAEISKLRAEQAAQAERLDAIERGKRPTPAAAADANAAAAPPPAPMPLDGDRPSLDVVRLGPSDDAPSEVDGDADADGPRTVLRSGASGIVVEETGPGGVSRVTPDVASRKSDKKSDKGDRKKTASVSTP
jgi:hypothetical protein